MCECSLDCSTVLDWVETGFGNIGSGHGRKENKD